MPTTRALSLALALAAGTLAQGCEDPEAPPWNTWIGTAAWTDGRFSPQPVPGAVAFSLTLGGSGDQLTGSGTLADQLNQLKYNLSVTGARRDSLVAFEIAAPGFGTFRFDGTMDFVLRLLRGRLNGAGFADTPVTFCQVPFGCS